ncbi:MAG TPA: hypothetical protein VHS28_08035 [Chloroflexota bacterium]|nr:hypothetical protein [Chloroflexota bacterium]
MMDIRPLLERATVWLVYRMKKFSKSTLRWYIGTKSLMPIVEIRRRFGIEGDEVTVLEDEQGKLYVGLPQQAAQALEELRQQGKIGYELSVDFHPRVLIGAYVLLKKKGDEAPSGQQPDPPEEDAA